MSDEKAKQLIDLYKRQKGTRQNFESYWQTLHDYFYIEGQNINTQYAKGSELSATYLYDATTIDCADVLASGFMNYLTPPTSKWAKLVHKDEHARENKEIMDYLEKVTDEIHLALNRSNFYNQMFPIYKASGVYGTSILFEEEDIEDGVRFTAIPIRQCVIVEDSRQRISQYFIEYEWTATQAADKFGKEKLTQEMQRELGIEKQNDKKHTFLLYIANRSVRDVRKTTKDNLPVAATWIDLKGRVILEESGYNEFPIMTHRFDKRPFCEWGFSPAMKSLPFARTLNAVAKTNLRSMMKHTDPAVAIPNNAFVMPLNQNPRAINYYNQKQMPGGGKDIYALGNTGNPQVGMLALEYYTGQVESLMYKDVFLAFNQLTKQMNNPEVAERIAEKMTLLGPAVGRYISEMLNPVIIRTFGILARTGRLPEPPDAMRNNPQYEVQVSSQLAQAQKRSDMNAMLTGLQLVGQLAQFDPNAIDNISVDKTVKEAWAITGAPTQILRSDDEIEAMRAARAQAVQQAQQMQMVNEGAKAVETGSKADLNASKAQKETVGV